MFRLTGETKIPTGTTRRGAWIEWDGGALDGDPHLISEAEMRVLRGETVKATPTGPSREAALNPEETAAILCSPLFERVTDWTGSFLASIYDYEGVS